jgi:large-conductance mechanosensitive channel
MDLVVGVIIGAAFGKIQIHEHIIMPVAGKTLWRIDE